ncbi:FYVE, RhoGEF and PH domain-containing protein 4 [Culicoides brevitarsis]|uniref:FYVE, RhoGEF and PH domain-containing protein 4 n=1 Tax=Culicoides brevitarsis TaxID=469753 RepID=UPI00307BE512
MSKMSRTPKKKIAPEPPAQEIDENSLFTPPVKQSFRTELKEALMKRNLLTVGSKNKAIQIIDDMDSSPETTPMKPSELRKRAIEEIRTSERRYLAQLETLRKFFIVPLKEKQLIDTKTHTALFGQIEMIYNLNKELLDELEADLNNVSKAFVKLAPFFKLYSVYAFDFKNALLLLQEESSKDLSFKKFLDDTETRPEVQMKLNSLLITPIQRVPRYKLLLQQVLEYTSPSETDHKILLESIKEIESTVQHINAVIEDQEHVQSLINLQNSLTNRSPSIVKPSRKILKEGALSKVLTSGNGQKYYCVLMSDIFMYCKVLKKRPSNTVVENSLQCCCIYPLRKSKVSEMFSANFKLSCQGEGIIFHAENDQQCREWVVKIKEVIDSLVESRKTLRKESSRKRPVKKKQLKYFETEYILSPPQKGIKYDYENVYKYTDLDKSIEKPAPKVKKSSKKVPKLKLTEAPEEETIAETPTKQPSTTNSRSGGLSRFQSLFSFFRHTPSNSQTYFKSSNVDSSIPSDVDFKFAIAGMLGGEHLSAVTPPPASNSGLKSFKSETNLQNLNTPDAEKDILYPLRRSLDRQNSSGKKRKQEKEEETHNSTKRVKFSDKEDVASESFFERYDQQHCQENVPKFKPPSSNGMSLKDRIVDFFSKLI